MAKSRRGPRFAYPCVAGPLDGQYATYEDFQDADGMYAHLSREYAAFNSSGGSAKRVGGRPSMIFVHQSALKPLISPRDR